MKLFTVRDHEVPFDLGPNSPTEYFIRSVPLPLALESFDNNATCQKELQEIQDILQTSNNNRSINLKFAKVNTKGNHPAAPPNIFENGRVIPRLIQVEGSFLTHLKKIYDDVRVNVTIEGIRWPQARSYNNNFGDLNLSESFQVPQTVILKTNEMEFDDASMCCEEEIQLPALWTNQFERVFPRTQQCGMRQYCIRISVTIAVASQIPETFFLARKMLEESIETDAVLVGDCGAEIKCHKCFLAAHSTELANMFQHGFQEAKTGVVKMRNMSKDGIIAFLEYLYYWGTDKPEQNSAIALELFEAAHQYNVSSLEKRMKQILLRKQNDWYDVSVALRVFMFARNVDGCDDITKKSIMVLKSKFSQLQASEEYKRMFNKDPKAAMEFCASAFSVWQGETPSQN